MHQSPTTLSEILNYKRKEIARQKETCPLSTLQMSGAEAHSKRPFLKNIQQHIKIYKIAIIAELKKASPSAGIIAKTFDVRAIAKAYTEGGAACLSVLTDREFFKGAAEYISIVKSVSPLPVLRKDFILDEYQIYESKRLGADAILLIVAALEDEALKRFYELALALGLDVLIEVHNEQELERALLLNPPLIGINNRNLHTFKVDLKTTLNLLPYIPKNTTVVSESGIRTIQDIRTLHAKGVQAFLVGEALMQAGDPQVILKKWLAELPRFLTQE